MIGAKHTLAPRMLNHGELNNAEVEVDKTSIASDKLIKQNGRPYVGGGGGTCRHNMTPCLPPKLCLTFCGPASPSVQAALGKARVGEFPFGQPAQRKEGTYRDLKGSLRSIRDFLGDAYPSSD